MNPTLPAPQPNLPKELETVSVVHLTDPTAVRDSIEVLNQDVVNLDPRGFAVKRVTVPLADCCLIYHRSNTALRTQTRVHTQFDSCTVLGPQARGSIDGMELHSYAMLAAGHGVQAEIIVDRDYESVALLVPPQVLHDHLVKRRIRNDFVFPDKQEVWHPETEVARRLYELGAQIAATAESTPGIFDDHLWARYGAQVEFMDCLFLAIESCTAADNTNADKKGKSYSQIVRTCEEYTLKLDGRRPYLSELCAAASVSERTLQYAFQEIMGMSPLTYLHRLRLHRARDELQRARSGSVTVSDVAMNWGFWHFGDFSRAYSNCFGEVPSATLKQKPVD